MIRRIVSIENVGKFENLGAGDDLAFARFNVIYGDNGRGKTTLSAILRSLSSGNSDPILERQRLNSEEQPRVQIDLEDGTVAVFENGAWSQIDPNIAVFDDVFVSENVCSGIEIDKQHRDNLHELIIGAEGVRLNSELNSLINRIEQHIVTLRDAAGRIPANIRGPFSVDEFCDLDQEEDIDDQLAAAGKRLAAARSSAAIAEAALFPELTLPAIDLASLEEILSASLEGLAAETVGRVRTHFEHLGDKGEQWVAHGMGLLQKDGDSNPCPFCEQSLTSSSIFQHYESYFSEAYRNLRGRISEYDDSVKTEHRGDVQSAFERRVREVIERREFWERFTDVPRVQVDTAEILRAWNAVRDGILNQLRQKIANPLEPIAVDDGVNRASVQYEEFRAVVAELNEALHAANDQIALVKEQTQVDNLDALSQDFSRLQAIKTRFNPEISDLCTAYIEERNAKSTCEEARNAARAALNAHRDVVFPRYGELINAFLQRFNASFRIGPVQPVNQRSGSTTQYSIQIDGQNVALSSENAEPKFKSALSAGDRNTLALAFFFARLDQDPNLGQVTVVIDDPMTSLDADRTLHTCHEIDQISRRAGKTIVLSHSGPFLASVWKECRQQEKLALQTRHAGGATDLATWNVNDVQVTEHDRRYSRTVEFIQNSDPEMARQVAEGLRPMIESYLRVAFAPNFAPGRMLGQFIQDGRQSLGTGHQIMSAAALEELVRLNGFARRYHHAENRAWETQAINTNELVDFASRTIRFISRD